MISRGMVSGQVSKRKVGESNRPLLGFTVVDDDAGAVSCQMWQNGNESLPDLQPNDVVKLVLDRVEKNDYSLGGVRFNVRELVIEGSMQFVAKKV